MEARPAYAATWPEPASPAASNGRLSLRPREIAKLTGLSPAKVYQAIYAGTLTAHQIGKAWIVPIDAFERWVGTEAGSALRG